MNRRQLSLRWFGSLNNVSGRRSSEKTNVKAPEHHGSLGEAKQSADDMDACLRSAGYAHSSQMYTHVGTVPRSQSQRKSSRGQKEEKKKKKEEEERSQRRAGEHVRDSPLLSVLSSLSRTLPGPALAGPPPTNNPPPLTSAHGSRLDDPPADPFKSSGGALETEPINMATSGPRAACSQDLYVPMDPIAEAARRQTQEKPVSGGEEAELEDSQQDVTDSSGEYVKFSKEQFWKEPPSDKLRKQLEEELKLSGSNLKSHAWYHGRVPWKVSESLVLNHGDFLLRDSQSSRGDFVLTVRWEQKTLHFVVTTTAAVGSSETDPRVRYGLEAEAFDSLPDLVRFFAASGAALSRWSAARTLRPVDRTLPLGYLETAFGAAVSPPSCRRGLKDGSGEQEVLPRSPSSLHQRETDVNTQLSAGGSLISALHNNPVGSRAAGAASPLFASPSGTLRRRGPSQDAPPPVDPRSYVERLRAEDGPARVEDDNAYRSPVVETASSFTPSRYRSPLLPAENRPLEVGVLRRVKELLAEVDPRTAARHITKADCRVARIVEVTAEEQRMMGVSSGMELLTLPHGQRLRLDLLERFQTMATTLAVDVLGCTGTTEERAGLLHKIIQIAAELKGTTGDMFGFAAVMRALELPQVSRLEQTWTALRQRHTEGAILYEKTLRPFMKSLNDGTESCPLAATTFPHVLPLLSLLERGVEVGEGAEPWETAEVGVDMVMFHLGAARTIAQLGGVYRSNAESKLQGFLEQPEVLELFLTDFQMRLLWGSRGAEETQALRHAKFDQVLTALSNRLEPPVRRR
ncbi:SH2 domain containing 3Cb isoform 2-T3 [Spinachia spinachia]